MTSELSVETCAKWPDDLRATLARAGVSCAELASILKVSRVALSRWLNRHTTPTSRNMLRLQFIAGGISQAVERGVLPRRDSSGTVEERTVTLKALLKPILAETLPNRGDG